MARQASKLVGQRLEVVTKAWVEPRMGFEGSWDHRQMESGARTQGSGGGDDRKGRLCEPSQAKDKGHDLSLITSFNGRTHFLHLHELTRGPSTGHPSVSGGDGNNGRG